jgi:hypothetical protein
MSGGGACARARLTEPLSRDVRAAVLPRRLRDTNALGGVSWNWQAGGEKWPCLMWLDCPLMWGNDKRRATTVMAPEGLEKWLEGFVHDNKQDPFNLPKMGDVMAMPLVGTNLILWIDQTIGECAHGLLPDGCLQGLGLRVYG